MLISQLYPEHGSGKHADDFTFGYDWGVGGHSGGVASRRAEICPIPVWASIENLQPNEKRTAVQQSDLAGCDNCWDHN
jgi:hypothetical protein